MLKKRAIYGLFIYEKLQKTPSELQNLIDSVMGNYIGIYNMTECATDMDLACIFITVIWLRYYKLQNIY